MKKVLFATTALVMTAGVAAAEVSVGGNGRMGIVYDGQNANFSSRARVEFTLSGETDGGLAFGGFFRANDAADAASGTAGSVYVSGAFGKIEMGDVTSAPEALFGDLPEVGFTDLTMKVPGTVDYPSISLSNDIPYLTLDNGTQSAMLYTYSVGGLSVAAAMSDSTNPVDEDDVDTLFDETLMNDVQAYSVAAAYTFGNYTVGLGYEVLDGEGWKATQTELAGVATFGDTAVKVYYADGGDDSPVDNAYGLGVSSKFGAVGVMAYAQKLSLTDDVGGDDVTWYGLGASYDLGGGASIVGGVADNDMSGTDPVADLGLKFTF